MIVISYQGARYFGKELLPYATENRKRAQISVPFSLEVVYQMRGLTARVPITKTAPKTKHNTNTQKKKLRGLSPRANYTDRPAAAGRRS